MPNNDESALHGERIRELRQQANLSQTELAVISGTSLSTIHRAERSDPNLSHRTVRRIANALKVTPGELHDELELDEVFGEEEPTPRWAVELSRQIEDLHTDLQAHDERVGEVIRKQAEDLMPALLKPMSDKIDHIDTVASNYENPAAHIK